MWATIYFCAIVDVRSQLYFMCGDLGEEPCSWPHVKSTSTRKLAWLHYYRFPYWHLVGWGKWTRGWDNYVNICWKRAQSRKVGDLGRSSKHHLLLTRSTWTEPTTVVNISSISCFGKYQLFQTFIRNSVGGCILVQLITAGKGPPFIKP